MVWLEKRKNNMATSRPQTFSENVAAYGEEPRRATPEELTEKKISQSTLTDEGKSVARAKAAGKYFEGEEAEKRLREEGPASPYWSAYKDIAVRQNPNLRDPLAGEEDRAQEANFKRQQFRTAKQAGLTDDMARAHSEQAWGNALTEKRIAMKKGLLSAAEHQKALEEEEETLNAKQTAAVLRDKAKSFDPDNMIAFPQQILGFTADHAHELANPSVKAEIEPFLTQLSQRHKASESSVNAAVAAMATDLKLKAATPSMFDPTTGRFDAGLAASEIERIRAEKSQRDLAQKGAEAEIQAKKAIGISEAREEQKRKEYEASPKARYEATREKVQNLNMANQLVKGIPLALIDNEEEITTGKVKWYSASRDKSGRMVPDPNGEFRVFENPKDKKSPYQIIPKTDLEQARILKSGGQETPPTTITDELFPPKQ
jgi:hypothetical protein